MCKIINIEDVKPSADITEKLPLDHQVISFTEMNEGIEDARILKAKISLFAKSLIEDGFDDLLVYKQLYATANSMSCLHSKSDLEFVQYVHDELAKYFPDLCYKELGIDDQV